jgi:hypothetical protein
MKPNQPTLEEMGLEQTGFELIRNTLGKFIMNYFFTSDPKEQAITHDCDVWLKNVGANIIFNDPRISELLSHLVLGTIIMERAAKEYESCLLADRAASIREIIDFSNQDFLEVIELLRISLKNKRGINKIKRGYVTAIDRLDYDSVIKHVIALFNFIKLGMILTLKEFGVISGNFHIVDDKMKSFIDSTKQMDEKQIIRN